MMQIAKPSEIKPEVENRPLFSGKVTRQTLVAANTGKNFNASLINFAPGARNKFHTHISDQILIVTAGKGIVATEKQEFSVGVGDVILIPAGENHWHGAAKNSSFYHISIQPKESQTTQVEK
jgi:quercetin dioxygenase-like cupin family protein